MSGSGLRVTLESILSHGARRLPDRSLRLQLLVFNSALLLSFGLTLGLGLIYLVLGDSEALLRSTLPFLALFTIIYVFARQRYFLLARILYVALALIGVGFGVHLHGNDSHLSLYCLDLALLPFLLFRIRECRWMILSSGLAFLLFVSIEFDLFLIQPTALQKELHPSAKLMLSTGAFIGVLAPSLLVFWQNHLGFRRTLRLNRVRARAEKFAAIGRLAAGAAHEINNPLAIVQLTLENLESSCETKEPILHTRIKRAYEAILRIHQILQKLRASTLLPASQPDSWLVSEVAQLIGQRCQRYLKTQGIHLSIRTHVPPGYRVLCHRQSMMDVVDSLINNVLDATVGQGRPRVMLTLTCENLHFVMKLEDNGPGISEEHLRSMFTPFFTTRNIGAGLGLSLYSARCIAQQYGGDLTCDRGPGGCFYLSLPLEPDSTSRQA